MAGEVDPEGDGGRGVTSAIGIIEGHDDLLDVREGPDVDLREASVLRAVARVSWPIPVRLAGRMSMALSVIRTAYRPRGTMPPAASALKPGDTDATCSVESCVTCHGGR